jgi:prepilin-type N-terminal cleavage/methylation domain-containing protein/prepilin-type processing-associated H-X9-DG protein
VKKGKMRAKREMSNCVRRGFTLVELLTVIAIIAVLTAILFPVFSSTREKGRQVKCMSNLRQIGIALKAYATDVGGFLPLANNRPSVDGAPGLPDVLMSYARSSQIFRCPSDRDNTWQTEGTSYDYALGMLNIGMPVQRSDRPWNQENSTCPLISDFSESWHAGGPNVLYVDGHVKHVVTR